ncbi:hypothetical protein BH24ACI5_BH24ACI5_00780 [soil metagenome]
MNHPPIPSDWRARIWARLKLGTRSSEHTGATGVGGISSSPCRRAHSHFIVDRHPHASNVWIGGGGSGHGFKMGPALGELVSALVLSDGTPDAQLRLSRFAKREVR